MAPSSQSSPLTGPSCAVRPGPQPTRFTPWMPFIVSFTDGDLNDCVSPKTGDTSVARVGMPFPRVQTFENSLQIPLLALGPRLLLVRITWEPKAWGGARNCPGTSAPAPAPSRARLLPQPPPPITALITTPATPCASRGHRRGSEGAPRPPRLHGTPANWAQLSSLDTWHLAGQLLPQPLVPHELHQSWGSSSPVEERAVPGPQRLSLVSRVMSGASASRKRAASVREPE